MCVCHQDGGIKATRYVAGGHKFQGESHRRAEPQVLLMGQANTGHSWETMMHLSIQQCFATVESTRQRPSTTTPPGVTCAGSCHGTLYPPGFVSSWQNTLGYFIPLSLNFFNSSWCCLPFLVHRTSPDHYLIFKS